MSSEEKRLSLDKILAVVPPASELKKSEKILKEIRIRVRKKSGLGSTILVPKVIANKLGINDGDEVEISVKGERIAGVAKIIEEEAEHIYADEDEMKERGIEDNSIVTFRKK